MFFAAVAVAFGYVPVGVVVEGDPAAFFGAVEPFFVVLVEDLDAARFEDVEDFVGVGAGVVEVGDGALPHFAVSGVEGEQEVVGGFVEFAGVEADAAGFFGEDGVAVRGVAGVEGFGDAADVDGVVDVVGKQLFAQFDGEGFGSVHCADDEGVATAPMTRGWT